MYKQRTGFGLSATLVRTKTSGKDKSTQQLFVFVALEAYFQQKDWLTVGYNLWMQVHSRRDYFVCLPHNDFSTVQFVEPIRR